MKNPTPDWEIVDDQGFTWLRLGMDRSSIRAILGPYRTFRRWHAPTETDHFVETGFLVTYGLDDHASLFEVTTPAAPRLAGVVLLERPLDDVVQELAQAGLRVTYDMEAKLVGATVHGWLKLYAPGDAVEAVSIGD
jgi:hypothetical protein